MKNLATRLTTLLVTSTVLTAQALTPFEKGVNLSNWFQGGTVHEIDFLRYTYDDLEDIQTLGVDVIRLPINFHGMSSGDPDYILDPILLDFLDDIVDWTEDLGLHLILDNHSFDDGGPTTPSVHTPLSKVWPQLAEHFLDRDSTLYFEIKNEPWDISDFIWDTIQQNIVNLIREIDEDRTLIVGPSSWNSYNNLDAMMNYTDDNLIYTFHFYDPFIFTHQGASWTSPSMEPLAGVPFPHDAATIPPCPSELLGTWIQSNLVSYPTQGTAENMRNLIDIAAAFRTSRGVPIYCGEFGAYMRYTDPEHRVAWYRTTTEYLDSLEIGWTMWDYHGGFGLFEPYSYGMFDHDLNIPLAEAIGFDPPPQSDYVHLADSVGFNIYDDYVAKYTSPDFNTEGQALIYDTEAPYMGNYNIKWSGAVQYERLTFNFTPDRDLSRLVNNGFILTFWAKGLGSSTDLDIRFVDTKNDVPEDHPWRMTVYLSSTDFVWDGSWNYVQIPLAEMVETGSWDGAWFDPQGLFDWSDIDNLEFVAEHGDMHDGIFYLDEIRIVDAITARTDHSQVIPDSPSLFQNYPNPFNPSTTINYILAENSFITLTIYDVNGRPVETLVAERKNAGSHSVTWNTGGTNLEAGIYFLELENAKTREIVKMLLLK